MSRLADFPGVPLSDLEHDGTGGFRLKILPFVDASSCAHNESFECASCGNARHDRLHPSGDIDGCETCRLRGIRIYGRFTGPASTSDAVQEFYSTGDPAVFDRQDQAARAARTDRLTSIG